MADTMDFTWEQITRLLDDISSKILSSDKPIDTVVGLSRGGLIPGVILSHRINAKFVPVVWQTRDANVQWTNLVQVHNSPNVLFVDDLVDSGKTYWQIKEHAPDARYCAMFNKQPEIVLDFCGMPLYNESRWLVFPWEE